MRIKREDCPALDIHGEEKEVTVIAWIKRRADNHWQYIAGMWDEGDARFKGKTHGVGENCGRQYALFLNGHQQADYQSFTRTDADNQIHGYVSDSGGATSGKPFSFSYATGQTFIEKDTWYMIAYTYDHQALRVYVNGELDRNGNCNPFYWDKPYQRRRERGGGFYRGATVRTFLARLPERDARQHRRVWRDTGWVSGL